MPLTVHGPICPWLEYGIVGLRTHILSCVLPIGVRVVEHVFHCQMNWIAFPICRMTHLVNYHHGSIFLQKDKIIESLF